MALDSPVFRYRASAAAVLEHLRGVEKQVRNEGLVFDKGTVQHLEDVITGIKELEEERKNILELLEDETIKNCKLRVKVKEIPEMVVKEFEALVAAARKFQFSKITEIQKAVQEIICAIEQTHKKHLLAQECNVALWEEQKAFRSEHEDSIRFLNEHMQTKHGFNIQINELQNIEKEEEAEIAWKTQLIEELEKKRAFEKSVFKAEQESLENQIEELQCKVQENKLKVSEKKTDYNSRLAVLKAVISQVKEKKQLITTETNDLAELFKQVKLLINAFKTKRSEKQEILQKKASIQKTILTADFFYKDESEAVRQKLKEAEKQMAISMQALEARRSENNLFMGQYENLQVEEKKFSSRRNQLAVQFERLSGELSEKLDRVTKRVMEIQCLEEEKEKIEEMLATSETSYTRELQALEYTLQKETDRSTLLRDQLDELIAEYKLLQYTHDDYMCDTKEKTEAGQRQHSNLLKENEELEFEIEQSEQEFETLSNNYFNKGTWFKKYTANVTEELENLEEQYNSQTQLLQEKEERLCTTTPYAEQLQHILMEKNSSYETLMATFTDLESEEATLVSGIMHAERETLRLRGQKIYFKGKIVATREAAKEQLETFLESLRFLEKDYYEVSRKLYIVEGENARFREAIAHLRADISALEDETEAYRLQREQIQRELGALQGLFNKRWSWDKHLWQVFFKGQHKVLKELEKHIEKCKRRTEMVNYVGKGLQMHSRGMTSFLEGEVNTEFYQESSTEEEMSSFSA